MAITLELLAGLVGLYLGAEWLVRGGASLAVRLGVSPLLVGLTVVAYGTSTPELIVSATAAFHGQGAIAIGNAVGSNIFNIGMILGLAALIYPMRVEFQLLKFDTPVMIGVAVLFLLFFLDAKIALWEALVFLACIIVYTAATIRLARSQASVELHCQFSEGVPRPRGSPFQDAGMVFAGMVALMAGSKFLVDGAVELARMAKLSEAVIGLTIVSAGTGLPELASSLMAAWRKQPDIALGNVIGSNIYNIVATLGVCGVIRHPLEGQGVGMVDVWVMVGLSVLLMIIAWTGFKLRRGEGLLLLLIYGGYIWHLWPKS